MRELDVNTFDEAINSETPVVVDFWAAWCGPCRILAPVLEELSNEVDGVAEICKVNIDDHGELATRYSVSSIPTLILFKDGEEVERMIGVHPKADILSMIERFK